MQKLNTKRTKSRTIKKDDSALCMQILSLGDMRA
jgi:hypothetical protein